MKDESTEAAYRRDGEKNGRYEKRVTVSPEHNAQVTGSNVKNIAEDESELQNIQFSVMCSISVHWGRR